MPTRKPINTGSMTMIRGRSTGHSRWLGQLGRTPAQRFPRSARERKEEQTTMTNDEILRITVLNSWKPRLAPNLRSLHLVKTNQLIGHKSGPIRRLYVQVDRGTLSLFPVAGCSPGGKAPSDWLALTAPIEKEIPDWLNLEPRPSMLSSCGERGCRVPTQACAAVESFK
jgi:hypothetical protein